MNILYFVCFTWLSPGVLIIIINFLVKSMNKIISLHEHLETTESRLRLVAGESLPTFDLDSGSGVRPANRLH